MNIFMSILETINKRLQELHPDLVGFDVFPNNLYRDDAIGEDPCHVIVFKKTGNKRVYMSKEDFNDIEWFYILNVLFNNRKLCDFR